MWQISYPKELNYSFFATNVSGLVKTLHGLNIINNPLEFPPAEILSQGTYEIQKFLREMLQAKSNANMKEGKEYSLGVLHSYA